MQSFDFKKLLPNLLIVVGFALLALFFSFPQLKGLVLDQLDTKAWRASAEEGIKAYEKTGENVLWSNSMFGGMPTYTHYVPAGHNYMWKIQEAITGTLGKPAAFFFIALVCFFMLMRAFNINRWLSIVGAIAYAFSTYNPVIINAGHETKMLALGYFPAIIAGLIYIYRSDWWKGVPMLALSLGLMMTTAHYQVVYYAMIVILFMVVAFLVMAAKQGKIKEFFISSVVALLVAIIAVGPSMGSVMSTMEYNKVTMRGGESELTITKDKADANKKGGLDKEYAFRYSNGIGETFSLMIPYLYGGGSAEPAEVAEKTNELTGGQYPQLPLYWGPQIMGIAGPVYFGAIVCFLFVLGLMVVRSPHKWWIVAVSALAIIMSWGNHFAGFNYFLFDTLPMLNKFRVPSMILVIPEILFPLLGIWGVHEIITGNQDKKELLKKLKIAVGITGGICLVIAVAGSAFFSYTSDADAQYPKELVKALMSDRADIAMKSAITSLVYILLAAGVIWAYLTDKLKNANLVIGGLGLLIAIDLFSVGTRYLNEDNFTEKVEEADLFPPRPVDQQILQDKDPYYRVLDLSVNTYNDATPSYFHKMIGGYSPAKMEIYQDMIDVHMGRSYNMEVLNMLNTKYIIFDPGNGQATAMPNTTANGNAWFVNEVKWVNTADEEILALNANKLGDTTKIPNAFNSKTTAVIRNNFKNELNGFTIGKDSAASIRLTKYGLNELSFESNNSQNGLGVFADIYYPYGWNAYVDGKETPIVKANYLLRAIKIPAGQHKIEFKFHPDTYYKYDRISMIFSFLLIGLCIASIIMLLKPKKETTA